MLQALTEHTGDHRHLLRPFISNPLGKVATGNDAEWLDDDVLHGDVLVSLLTDLELDLHHLRQHGPLPMFLRFYERHQGHRTVAFQDGERRLTNWRQLASLLHDQWAQGRRQATSLHAWLTRSIADPPQTDDDSSTSDMMWLETDEAAVQLVTIHGSKKALNTRLSSVHFYGLPKIV